MKKLILPATIVIVALFMVSCDVMMFVKTSVAAAKAVQAEIIDIKAASDRGDFDAVKKKIGATEEDGIRKLSAVAIEAAEKVVRHKKTPEADKAYESTYALHYSWKTLYNNIADMLFTSKPATPDTIKETQSTINKLKDLADRTVKEASMVK